MEIPLPIIVMLVLVSFAALLIPWHNRRSRSLLQRWADKHGYHIVHREDRIIRQGPYSWRGSSMHQTVYYVTVEDQNGQRRNAWVRCGGAFLGVLSDQVDFQWDKS